MSDKNIEEKEDGLTVAEKAVAANSKKKVVAPKKEVEITTKKIESVPQWAIDMQSKMRSLEEENAMFKEMAGKNNIQGYLDSKKDKTIKTAGFKIWNDKIVVGWSKLDYSRFNPKAPDGLTENILTTLTFSDNTTEQVNYVAFNNATDRISLQILKQVGDSTVVILPNGKEMTVETRFLNR